jgi:hypothetical protein
VTIDGLLSATGGSGGSGGCCGDGGGGGGGRIAYQYVSLVASGTAIVSGGTSGTRSTSGVCSPGGPSPDVAGGTGVVTKTKAPNTKITSASISSTNHRATFRFKAIGIATGFQCQLKRGNLSARFRNCSSPKTYVNLKLGRYIFKVRAIGPGGTDPTPATMRFRIA